VVLPGVEAFDDAVEVAAALAAVWEAAVAVDVAAAVAAAVVVVVASIAPAASEAGLPFASAPAVAEAPALPPPAEIVIAGQDAVSYGAPFSGPKTIPPPESTSPGCAPAGIWSTAVTVLPDPQTWNPELGVHVAIVAGNVAVLGFGPGVVDPSGFPAQSPTYGPA
jgi:hypothetical protein